MDIQSNSKNTFIIAEAGVNHNGSLDLALELCEKAKSVGADAIKFQTWITDNIVLKGAPQASYQQKNTKKDRDQYSLLKELELSFKKFEIISNFCKSLDLKFLSFLLKLFLLLLLLFRNVTINYFFILFLC